MKETRLFDPLRDYLQGQGYSVYSEVKNCDLVAQKDEETIIVEIKVQLSLRLVLQGVQRQELYPNVYLAVPINGGKKYPANYASVKRLLRRLGMGLIFVRFLKTKTRVEVVLHPDEPVKFSRPRSRRMIISEINGRYAEFNRSGEPSSTEKLTAYKQQAIAVAHFLYSREKASPAQMRAAGLPSKCQQILSSNFYGWFDRVDRGVYRLNNAGRQALDGYEPHIQAMGLE